MPAVTAHAFIEMLVKDVGKAPGHPNPVACIVLLEERDGDHRLPIWIGQEQAYGIALRLERLHLARPEAYDLTVSMVAALGGRLREVRIDRVSEGTFYATVVLDGPRGAAELDARPSDALNLALTAGTPILADRGTVEAAAVEPEAREVLEQWASGGFAGSRRLLEELFGEPPPPASE
jgi:bifunctional DNase/RNase